MTCRGDPMWSPVARRTQQTGHPRRGAPTNSCRTLNVSHPRGSPVATMGTHLVLWAPVKWAGRASLPASRAAVPRPPTPALRERRPPEGHWRRFRCSHSSCLARRFPCTVRPPLPARAGRSMVSAFQTSFHSRANESSHHWLLEMVGKVILGISLDAQPWWCDRWHDVRSQQAPSAFDPPSRI